MSNVIFYIINIHIITLGSLLGELVYYDFHLIYYTIETHTYKYIGGSVSFQCGIYIFSCLSIYKLHQQSLTSL
jgi:hypothetical protein